MDGNMAAVETPLKKEEAQAVALLTMEQKYINMLEKRVAELEAKLLQLEGSPQATKPGTKTKDQAAVDNETPPSQPGRSGRVLNVISKWDHTTDNRRDYDRQEAVQSKKSDQLTTFRRVMETDDDKCLDYEELDVEFDGLRDLLADNLNHMPPEQFKADHVKFVGPFKELVWQWSKLEKAAESKADDVEKTALARQDLKEALALIKTSESLENYFNSLASHRAGSTITFAYLWSLFEPGTKVYTKSFNSEMQLFEVAGTHKNDEHGMFFVTAIAFDWNGDNFLRYSYQFIIHKFEGAQSVMSLPCYPASYHHTDADPDGSQLRQKLLERGKLFYELCIEEEFQYEYEGPVLSAHKEHEQPGDEVDLIRLLQLRTQTASTNTRLSQLSKSKVIVDNYSYMNSRRNPDGGRLPLGRYVGLIRTGGCVCKACQTTVVTEIWASETANYTTKEEKRKAFGQSDERLRMCPPRVLGYSLLRRNWVQLSVNHVTSIASGTADDFETYFQDKLELDPAQKKLLKAMITYHVGSGERRLIADVVEGKGQGLVILLHGPPGVGKTLTAETVALATAKPLLSVSTAEIGMEPNEAERNFTAIFEDASRWKAVLLIDEADVFLEERRGANDLQRNALVAVLLRALEYYEGIIILTTNRITSLDVAVQSRIHLAIQYSDLKPKQKEQIFQYFLDEIIGKERIAGREEINQGIKKMVKKSRINGRQIRNILMSALLLSQSQSRGGKSKLTFEHIEEVLNATEDFLDCLKDLTVNRRGLNEAQSIM